MLTMFTSVLKDIDHSLTRDHRFGWKMIAVCTGLILGPIVGYGIVLTFNL